MKKIISIVLLLILTVSTCSVFAETPSNMERVLGIVKERIDIPEGYTEFGYSSGYEKNEEQFYFNWATPSQRARSSYGYISVSCTSGGIITNYNAYEDDYYSIAYRPEIKFPKLSAAESAEKAAEFFAKINPEIYSQFRKTDNSYNRSLSNGLYYNYVREIDGIPFPQDTAYISLDGRKSEVNSFYLNWTDVADFPKKDSAVSLEEAKKAFSDEIGIKLVYDTVWENGKAVPTLQYVSNGTYNQYINAVTNDLFIQSADFMSGGGMGGAKEEGINYAMSSKDDAGRQFTPQELKVIDEAAGLLTQDEALAKVKEIDILGIDKNARCTGSGIEYNSGNTRYIMYLYIINGGKDSNISDEQEKLMAASGENTIYISLDAKTGDILNFSSYGYYEPNSKAVMDSEKARKLSLEAAKKLLGKKANEFVVDESYKSNISPLSSVARPNDSNGIMMVRMVDGIPFVANTCNASYNVNTGKLESFYYGYDNFNFPSKDKAMSRDAALEQMFDKCKFGLKYITEKAEYFYVSNPNEYPINAALVYGFEENGSINAETGSLTYEVKYEKAPEYTDINEHWAKEKIEKLAEYGIYFEGSEFRPDDKIKQEELVTLLSVLFAGSPPEILRSAEAKQYLYDRFGGIQIVKQDEINPSADVTRLDATKFIVRAIGAEEYAEMDEIYVVPFSDVEEGIGYVALAYGLKIISASDRFNPDSGLTRAEAISLVYNYLGR